MTLTVQTVQQKKFNIKFRGFDVREVDEFLEAIAASLGEKDREIESLKNTVLRMKDEILAHRKRENMIKRTLVHSQQVVEQMKSNAREQAALIVREAELEAEKLLNAAHRRLEQINEDIAELKRQRMQIEAQIRSVIDVHTKLLDVGDAELKKIEAAESRVTQLRQV